MTASNVELDAKQLATVISSMLARSFIEAPRADAKRLFRAIRSEEPQPFMTMQLKHSGEFRCNLTLDETAFSGVLNFGIFRRALASHLERLAGAIEREEALNLYSDESGERTLFHHPGVVETDGQLNVLVSGTEQLGPALLLVRLQFLDPAALERALAGREDDGPEG